MAPVTGEFGSSESDSVSRLENSGAELQKKQADRECRRQGEAELYRRYELIRKRRGTALAWTSDGTCSACHIRLAPMLFQKLLREDEFGQCPSCNRILYFRAVSQPATETEPGGP